jgi:diadenosine tetraphosphate (Ap4A) HIT family hydrolase
MSEAGCPFCDKLARLDRLAKYELVWRFLHSVALLGPWQRYQGYCVLVSRRHARELFELPRDERRGYLEEMCLLAEAIHRAFSPHKLNYELLGNQVPHLHWHLFPRSADDPERLQPVWLALDAAERDPERRRQMQTGPSERSATAAELRRVLSAMGAPSP